RRRYSTHGLAAGSLLAWALTARPPGSSTPRRDWKAGQSQVQPEDVPAPQLYLPGFLDEATERDLAMRLCLGLVVLADEVRVYGEPSAGMLEEIAEARRLGIPVIREEGP
ncbi:MAG: hypothetical protein ACRD88_06430, partial [Terriglobia bacterium]